MIKIGKKFGAEGMTPSTRIQALTEWESWASDSMPSNERMGQLLELAECPSLADFLAIFEPPIEVELMGDRVWPPERPSVY